MGSKLQLLLCYQFFTPFLAAQLEARFSFIEILIIYSYTTYILLCIIWLQREKIASNWIGTPTSNFISAPQNHSERFFPPKVCQIIFDKTKYQPNHKNLFFFLFNTANAISTHCLCTVGIWIVFVWHFCVTKQMTINLFTLFAFFSATS